MENSELDSKPSFAWKGDVKWISSVSVAKRQKFLEKPHVN